MGFFKKQFCCHNNIDEEAEVSRCKDCQQWFLNGKVGGMEVGRFGLLTMSDKAFAKYQQSQYDLAVSLSDAESTADEIAEDNMPFYDEFKKRQKQ